MPNPDKKKAYQKVVAARAHYDQVLAQTDAAMLALRTPAPGTNEVTITNAMHNQVTAPLWAAETALDRAEAATRRSPSGSRWESSHPANKSSTPRRN
ncbi:hypothetical protein AHiyo4_20970 [Arthrobacter sp. Hiyo4]|nr:hypothetical protein AHiyo4_20970 [Arthrobacter sp. Hiyo4]